MTLTSRMWKRATHVGNCLGYHSYGMFNPSRRVCPDTQQRFGVRHGFGLPVLYSSVRHSSYCPRATSIKSEHQRKKVTVQQLRKLYAAAEPITMLTAHDVPSASAADRAGVDVILAGDSLAMVALGCADTTEITLDELLLHCKSVAKGARSAFLVSQRRIQSGSISQGAR